MARSVALLLALLPAAGAYHAGAAVGWQAAAPSQAAARARAAGWGVESVKGEQAAALGQRFHLGKPANRRAVRPSMRAAAKSHSVGGARSEATLTALVAGISVGLLCALGQYTTKNFGLPLWAPPLGAVSLIFAMEATAAATEGKTMAPAAIWQRALKAGSAVAGACFIAVLVTRMVGATPLGRALAVTTASLWMTAFPMSGYFPPTGAFCALYVDQAIGNGPLAAMGLRYALFPCGAGTVLLIIFTRVLAGILAKPLRAMRKSKQVQEA